ncbi:phosphoglycerate mutase [Luteimonas sp. RIT-PG2_3]
MQVTLLLPAMRRLGGQRLSVASARWLGRGSLAGPLEPGRQAQLRRQFQLHPGHWAVAALTRLDDRGDAAGDTWVRADPCHVRPDLNGARLLAIGDGLALAQADADALLPALEPLFADVGWHIDAGSPGRWYLRLPPGTALPDFMEPDDALGTDLIDHMIEGPQGRQWRALLSEAQVVLHNHPWNEARARAGKPPINSLWFWGGGRLPERVEAACEAFHSNDEVALALAAAAGVAAILPERFVPSTHRQAFDLVAVRDLARLEGDWLVPAFDALREGRLQQLCLDGEDGVSRVLRRGDRWRVWRRPAAGVFA